MSYRNHGRPLLYLALTFQVLLLMAAGFAFWQVSRYMELSFRRSVEKTAAQAVAQWYEHLQTLAKREDQLDSLERAHLLPIAPLARGELVPGAPLERETWPPVPNSPVKMKLDWPGDFSQGLSGRAEVKALPSCGRCHPSFSPGEVVGNLVFQVKTDFLTALLAARRQNVAALVFALTALLSLGMWLLAILAFRRQRQAEAAAREARQALLASEERYRSLVENSLVGVYLVQGDRFLYCNPRMAEMFGYSQEEIMASKRVFDLIAPEDRALVAENLRKRFVGEVKAVRYSFTALKSDGTRFPVEAFGVRIGSPTEPKVLGTIVDNTATERARQVLESAYRAVVALPRENLFQTATASLARFLDVPVAFAGELVDQQLRLLGWFGPVRGEILPLKGTACAQLIEGKRMVEIPRGFLEKYGGEPFVNFVCESYCGFPLVDSEGRVVGALAVADAKPRLFDDLEKRILEIYAVRLARELETQKLLRRRQELERQLAVSEKLAALGELAGGVAHDFNNVLAGILAEVEPLAPHLPAEQRFRAQRIVELAQRGGEVVRRILGFAYPAPLQMETLSVERLLQEVFTLAHSGLGPQVKIESEVEPGLFVKGDLGNLQQVFLNLLNNARDAMPHGGTVRLTARRQEDKVVFQVEDQGKGIPPELLPRVLEPFFTSKPRGRGTGLGLTTAYRTVEAHGGQLAIWSEVNKGTRVTISLPAAVGPSAASVQLTSGPVAEPTQALVLLVDDEPAILEGLAEGLTWEGYQVQAFTSGEEAWQWAQEHRADAVVLDVLLPGMDGLELAEKLLERDPEVAIILSSGFAPGALPPSLASHRRLAFLQKPYTLRQLLEVLGKFTSPG
ncbi:MAG: ATP-binding protein [Thermoanaerobaculaceae bacterium]